jgi:hypothetical protein
MTTSLAVTQGNLTPKTGTVFLGVPSAMHEEFVIECPYCGEHVDVYVEADVTGSFIQDCEVCCNPWRVDVRDEDGERYIAVRRADGSE